jgi:Ca-activated chloride channel family protein
VRVQRWAGLLAVAASVGPLGSLAPPGPAVAPGGVAHPTVTAPAPAPEPPAPAPGPPAPGSPAPADGQPPRALLLLVDGSDAMRAPLADGRPRWDAVREAVATTAADLPDGTVVGLRVAAADPAVVPAGCADTRPLTPVGLLDRPALASALAPLAPVGTSSTAEGLRAAVDDLPANAQATVVLVASRLGGCVPGETCGAARELVDRGVGLRVDAVAVGADVATLEELHCVVQATGGALRTADTSPALTSALTRSALRALSPVARRTVQDVRRDGDGPVTLPPGTYGEVLRPGASRRYLVDLAEGSELLATVSAAAPPEVADRVVLRLSVGEASTPPGGAGAGDSARVLLGVTRQSLRLRTGPSAGSTTLSTGAPGARSVPVDVALEQYGGGALPPVEVPVLLDLDVVDTLVVVEEAAEPVVLQAPAPPPERVVVPRDRVPVWMWGLVGALVWAVVALGLVLATVAVPPRRRLDAEG